MQQTPTEGETNDMAEMVGDRPLLASEREHLDSISGFHKITQTLLINSPPMSGRFTETNLKNLEYLPRVKN